VDGNEGGAGDEASVRVAETIAAAVDPASPSSRRGTAHPSLSNRQKDDRGGRARAPLRTTSMLITA